MKIIMGADPAGFALKNYIKTDLLKRGYEIVDIDPEDRIMTLSTCCRRIVPTYPNGYRCVVMGRLVEKGKLLTYERSICENPTALTVNNIYE